jgi:hypothetical protein
MEAPRNGDLVFYRAGYAMFYFADPREGPFVLGMTPFGVAALKIRLCKAYRLSTSAVAIVRLYYWLVI